ncbi:MAG: hypothetical protein SFV18_18035 [Bryobacteraceae bacterium]|nr:hypothetical protein [Bryobacteraceae bacterium]
MDRARAPELLDRLTPAQFEAVERLLGVMADPWSELPVEDEEVNPATARALDEARLSLSRGEGIPHEEVLREFAGSLAR